MLSRMPPDLRPTGRPAFLHTLALPVSQDGGLSDKEHRPAQAPFNRSAINNH